MITGEGSLLELLGQDVFLQPAARQTELNHTAITF